MLKEQMFASVMNVGQNVAAEYAGLGHLWGAYLSENPTIDDQWHDAFRPTKASEAISRFLQLVRSESEFQESVIRSVLGIFDGQLYLWLFTRGIDTEITRRLFALKAAVEQQVRAEFEIHVEPLNNRSVEELIPTGFTALQV